MKIADAPVRCYAVEVAFFGIIMIIVWIVNDVFLVNRKLFLIVTYEMDDKDQLSEEVISLVKFLLNQEFTLF